MSHKGFAKLFIPILFLTLIPLISSAAVITIEPDDYALGADLSHASPFVTLESVNSTGDHRPILSELPKWGFASTGASNFGKQQMGCLRGDCSVDDYEGFGLFFDQSVSRVSLLALNWGYDAGLHANWAAFDQSGDRIAFGRSAIASLGETVLVDIRLEGMWSLFVGGGGNMSALEFDHLTFDIIDAPHSSVPEPASIGLLAAGMLGVVWSRRFTRL